MNNLLTLILGFDIMIIQHSIVREIRAENSEKLSVNARGSITSFKVRTVPVCGTSRGGRLRTVAQDSPAQAVPSTVT